MRAVSAKTTMAMEVALTDVASTVFASASTSSSPFLASLPSGAVFMMPGATAIFLVSGRAAESIKQIASAQP